jgi:beta-lactamase regulating signal transducer with metallopeptidase domain
MMVLSFLLDWAARGALLAGAAGLVAATFRIRDIRTRLALWSALLCGALVLPAVRPLTPPLLPPLSPPARLTRVSVAAPIVLPPVPRATTAPVRMAATRRSYLREAALSLWAAGALLLLARLFTGLILARRVIRAATPVEDRIRPMRGLRVLESARVSVPLTAGIFRPVVLLPESWREWESERLRAVLAHERSHVERRDGLVRVAARLHRAMLWFSPVAWWLERHLAELAECASDDSAVAETMDRSAYAAIVLDFFRAGRKPLVMEGLAMAQGGSAERRIDRILVGGPIRARLRRTTRIAVLVLTAGSVVMVAALQNRPAAPAPPGAPPAPAAAPKPSAMPEPAPAPAPRPEEPGVAWAIFHDGAARASLSGDDLREARAAYERAKQDMIWIRRGNRSWVISDAGLLQRARELYAPVDDLSNKQAALTTQLEALAGEEKLKSEAMEKLGDTRRIEGELKKVEEHLRAHEPTAEQLAQLQAKLAQMQSRLEEAQASMGSHEEEIARRMAELASRQEVLGRLQDEFGQASGQAGHELERMLDEAIGNGLARPCGPVY